MSTREAKRAVVKALEARGIKPLKVSGQRVSFIDLARESSVIVTVHSFHNRPLDLKVPGTTILWRHP